ncbi:MAG: TIGR04551 family protein [Myxococcota bacterium]
MAYPRCGHFPMIEASAASNAKLPCASSARAADARARPILIGLALAATAAAARATGFTDIGQDIEAHDKGAGAWSVELGGYLRLRGALFDNLDLDRGPTPSGELFFPVPIDDPTGQVLTAADLRLRGDLAVYAPGGAIAVKTRLDLLDTALGQDFEGTPSATTGQAATPLAVRRAYAEVLTPVGLLAFGRMGAEWGLGMVASGGDGLDDDAGDSADRIAFLTPLAGHIWALAWDFGASFAGAARKTPGLTVGLAPSSDVEALTFAVLKWYAPDARARRHAAGRTTLEYGLTASWRWQDEDVPAAWLGGRAAVANVDASQVVARNLGYGLADAWLRVQSRDLRVEAEGAVLWGEIGQASLVPGVHLRGAITSLQWGAALESELGRAESAVKVGLDLGVASGDPTPGFGAVPRGTNAPQAGDLDGPQASLPFDTRLDSFRFHSDYRIDRILFREIIGTVTDAAYARPHLTWRLVGFDRGELLFELAAVASMALEASSTPGGARGLGIEVDPTLVYRSTDGFVCALEHAVLFPLAGLDNPALGLSAAPAQLLRVRLQVAF